jgi:hypothetical protein
VSGLLRCLPWSYSDAWRRNGNTTPSSFFKEKSCLEALTRETQFRISWRVCIQKREHLRNWIVWEDGSVRTTGVSRPFTIKKIWWDHDWVPKHTYTVRLTKENETLETSRNQRKLEATRLSGKPSFATNVQGVSTATCFGFHWQSSVGTQYNK